MLGFPGAFRLNATVPWGLLVFFGLPILAIGALVTLVGIPLGLGLLAALGLLYALGGTVAPAVIGPRVGRLSP